MHLLCIGCTYMHVCLSVSIFCAACRTSGWSAACSLGAAVHCSDCSVVATAVYTIHELVVVRVRFFQMCIYWELYISLNQFTTDVYVLLGFTSRMCAAQLAGLMVTLFVGTSTFAIAIVTVVWAESSFSCVPWPNWFLLNDRGSETMSVVTIHKHSSPYSSNLLLQMRPMKHRDSQ